MINAILPIRPSLQTHQRQTAAAAATTPATTTSTTTPATGLANETTFLTLLVAQLQNQDPLNPADSTQFVTQLAQFSQLEDLQNINQNVINIAQNLAAAATPAPASKTPATPAAASL
jgi:flagellar basal-body rod modification protein FlgD